MPCQICIIAFWSCYGYTAGYIVERTGYTGKDGRSLERVAEKRASRNCLEWHIWPVVPRAIIHLTVLPSPDQALVSPFRDSSHCLKSTWTNPFCPNLVLNVGNVEDKTTFLQRLNGCGLSSCISTDTEGAQFMFFFSKVSLFLCWKEGGPDTSWWTSERTLFVPYLV